MGWRIIELPNGDLIMVKRKFSWKRWWRELKSTNVNLTTSYKPIIKERKHNNESK